MTSYYDCDLDDGEERYGWDKESELCEQNVYLILSRMITQSSNFAASKNTDDHLLFSFLAFHHHPSFVILHLSHHLPPQLKNGESEKKWTSV